MFLWSCKQDEIEWKLRKFSSKSFCFVGVVSILVLPTSKTPSHAQLQSCCSVPFHLKFIRIARSEMAVLLLIIGSWEIFVAGNPYCWVNPDGKTMVSWKLSQEGTQWRSWLYDADRCICRTGRKGRDPRNLCGRAAEEDDASLDQTGTGMCQSHTSHHFSLDDRLWEQLIVDCQDWLTHSVFLPIFTALISTPKFEDVYSNCFPAVQARDMQEVFRQAKLRTTRRCVDAWKALSSAERFFLHVWVEFKVVPWCTEHILKFHLLKCGCTQISDYFVVFAQGAATRCRRLRKLQLQVPSLRA